MFVSVLPFPVETDMWSIMLSFVKQLSPTPYQPLLKGYGSV